jgi:two-component system, sensor histidine kinase
LLVTSAKEKRRGMGLSKNGISGEINAPETRALRVLVVEDDEVNQILAKSIMTMAGHRCDVVENGAKAVAAVQETAYDVVLMDIHMPVMDGLEATRRIRRLDGPVSRIPIIALTADVVIGQKDDFDTIGMNAYVIKPIDSKLLLATLNDAVRK